MSKPRNWKRWFKRLGLGLLGLVALLLLINLILNVWANSKLEAKLQKLRDEGFPTCIADLAPEPIPDAQNAAAHLRDMKPELKRFEKAMVVFEERTPIGKAYVQRTDKYEGVLPTTEQAAAMQAILDDFSDLFLAVDEMAVCDHYASLLDYSLDHPHFVEEIISAMSIRRVARLLSWKMQVLTVQGENEQATEAGLQLLRLTRLYDEEPLLVNFLVGIACRLNAAYRLNQVLRSGPVSENLRDALDVELAKHDDSQRFVKTLLTERAGSLDAMESWKIAPVPIHWHFTFLQAELVDWFDEQFILAALPWHQSQKLFGKVDESKYSDILQMMTPATQAASVSFYRNIATLRCLRILNAAGAYHDEKGRQPTTLDDLDLPAEATLDPFNGKPLVFRTMESGWLIYSVFQNEIDDGGVFKKQEDWGLAPMPVVE
ncbi:MAG: hypothetical protein GXP24_02090 [Planctomycetes bacterium]|nr:hypothetical protein [Planctomycetota bacterium]